MNEITVLFQKEDGIWGEEVTFKVDPEQSNLENNIVSVKTPLVKAVSQLKVNQVGKLSTGESFLLVNKSYSRTLQGYLNKLNKLEKYDDNNLIKIGSEFPLLLAKVFHIPKKTKKLVSLIISAKLNKEDISVCIDWLFQLKKSGIYVDDIINKLTEIKSIKNGLKVENINDVYTLHQISNIYRDLRAYKKTKQILLKSLQFDSRNTITLTKLGKLSKLTGFFQEGVVIFTRKHLK
jgi:tetratricopeptide (TPR) repeat protein